MNQVAISIGELAIYWNSIIIVLGIIACCALSLALYTSHGGKASSMFIMLAVSILLSVFISRVLHWYCHEDQYNGLGHCLSDYSAGSFCVPGILFAVLISAKLVELLRLADSSKKLLDAIAPGEALCIAFIRLSNLFTSLGRSKIVVNKPLLQHLPIASPVTDSSGSTQYLFATFFIQFILTLILAIALANFFMNCRRRRIKGGYSSDGHVMNMFLLFYGCIEMVLDSTRYDASFIHFRLLTFLNKFTGFISFVQIVSAVCALVLLIKYSNISVRSEGRQWYHWLMWGLWVVGLGAGGACEYLVQRHGDWYLICYSIMSLGILLMTLIVHRMYIMCCQKKIDI